MSTKILSIRNISAALMTIPTVAMAQGERPKAINVAIVDFFSGAGAIAGGPSANMAKLTIDRINKAGGIAGVPIKAQYVDEAGGPAANVAKLRQIAKKVDVVVGYGSSSDCLAVAPVAEKLGVPLIASACDTTELFKKPYKWIFRTQIPDVSGSVAMAMYLLKTNPNVKVVAGINPDYSYGHDAWNYFVAAMKALGGNVEYKFEPALFPPLFSGQYTSHLSRLQAAKPDVVFSSLWGGDEMAALQQGKAQGIFKQTKFMFSVGTLAGVDGLKVMPNGVIVGSDEGYLFHPGEVENKELREYIDSYQKRFNEHPVSAFGYAMHRALEAMAAGYKKAVENNHGKWPSKEQFVNALVGLKIDTFQGPLVIRKDHQATFTDTVGEAVRSPEYPFAVFDKQIKFTPDLINLPEGTGIDYMAWVKTLTPELLKKVPEPTIYAKTGK